MIELLAVADDYFDKPITLEKQKSISAVWANSDLRNVPDDIAERAFFDVIQHHKWHNQLLPDWLDRIKKIQGEQVMLARSMQSLKRWRSNRLESAERKKLKQ